MVQTRGQQTGDQSPSSRGALRGVTAEGNAASTAATSGATLKPAVSVPSTEHSAAILAGGGFGRDGPVSPLGAGSLDTISMSAPMGASAHNGRRFKSLRWRPDDRQPTGDPRLPCHQRSDRWLGQRRPSRSIQCTAAQKPNQLTNYLWGSEQRSCYHELRFTERCAQPFRSACSSSRWDSVGQGNKHCSHGRSACQKRSCSQKVDKSGIDTALRDRRLANYEARLKQEEPVSAVPTAVVSASAPRSTEHCQMVYPGTGSSSDPLRIGETVSP